MIYKYYMTYPPKCFDSQRTVFRVIKPRREVSIRPIHIHIYSHATHIAADIQQCKCKGVKYQINFVIRRPVVFHKQRNKSNFC
jgi:hypothetical protein